jgi:hypothetical protein
MEHLRPVLLTTAVAGALVLAGAPAAQATVISGASEGFDATVDIQIPSLAINFVGGPVTSVSGMAPAPYDLSDTETTGFSLNGVTFEVGVTASFASSASSDVDGASGARLTDAAGGIEDVTITLTSFSTEILRVEIAQIIGSASVLGDYGSLSASGSTGPIDVLIDTPDWNPWSFQLTPAANQLLFDNGVVQIVGNEQITSCDGPAGGTDTCTIEVNALHILIDGSINGSYTHGEVIVGHASATMTAVPEPGTVLLLGFGLVLLSLRRRR